MLQKIIDYSIKNRLIIVLMVFALVIAGIQSLRSLPIDAVPDITDNQVQIITTVPSLGAPDIERLITFPIEQSIANIGGLKKTRSFSRFGLSLVTVVFDDDVDLYWARQQVLERLQKVQQELPTGLANPSLAPISTGLGEIYQYVVRPKKGFENKFNATELRTIQDWVVRRQLLHVKGVADVSSFGGNLKQYQISIDPSLLKAYHISMDEVFSAIAQNNQNTGGAYIEKGPNVLFIRTEGLASSLEDLQNIVLKTNPSGTPILVRNIAKVDYGRAIKYGTLLYNGAQEVSGAVVLMLKGENSSEVVKNVKAKVAEINTLLPKGVIIEPFLDRTKMVNNAIGTVEKNLIEGALIVIFILVLFLGNIRVGLITASVIPLSMLFAVMMMKIFGVSGNLMSLGAIDFGLIVDGAVIIVEAVMHKLYYSKQFAPLSVITQKEMDEEVSGSAGRMMNAAVFGQMIILIVYLPIFSLQGIEGKMFTPMAQTVAFALLGAFILSLTYIPMMSTWFLSKKIPAKASWSDKQMERIEHRFSLFFERIIRFPKWILLSVMGLFCFSVYILSQMGGEFIPQLEEGDFAVETRALPGTSLPKMIERTGIAAALLKNSFPEVEKVVAKIGSGEIPTDPMPIEAADMMVILKPKSEWKTASTFAALSDTMSKKLKEVPGLSFGFMFPVQMRFNELITGAKQDVVCKIYGEDLDTLANYAHLLGKYIHQVSGAKEIYVESITGIPQIVVNYRRTVLAQYGMSIASLNDAVSTAFAGKAAGQIFEGEKRFDLVVRLQDNQRKSIDDIQNLIVSTPTGLQLPLSTFADIRMVNSAHQIQREEGARRITVGFNIENTDVQTVVQDVQKLVQQKLHLPSGYYVTYGGTFENLQQAKTRLALAVPVALLLIFALLFFAFSSLKQALLVYSAIPLSSIGGILLLAFRGMPFSISAGIGFIALWGVAVLNGIVLITEFNRLRKLYPEKSVKEIIAEGTKSRLRPVLMTACVASMGFIPMALSHGAGAEVQRPLATVVIGGLLTATFLTLFILPILYQWTMKTPLKKNISVAMLLFGLLSFNALSSNAQTPIELQTALDSATKNSKSLQALHLSSQYFQEMKTTVAADMQKTVVNFDYGHVNSKAMDKRFSLTQTFDFPSVYKAKKAVFDTESQKSTAQYQLSAQEIRTQIRLCFYDYQVLVQKQKLLNQADSLFENFKTRAQNRLNAGESNALEFTNADNQSAQIRLQKNALQTQIQQLIHQFQYLLQTQNAYIPAVVDPKIELPQNEFSAEKHLSLAGFSAQFENIKAQQKANKTLGLPEIIIGAYSQTFIGFQQVGSQDVYFGPNTQFLTANVGLNFKLFGWAAQKRKNKSFNILMHQNSLEHDAQQLKLKNELYYWQQEYKNAEVALQVYETSLCLNAKKTIHLANQKLQLGDINFLNWVYLIQQNIQIQANYYDVLQQYNQSAIQLINFQNTK